MTELPASMIEEAARATRNVELRRGLIADVDLPDQYATTALEAAHPLITDRDGLSNCPHLSVIRDDAGCVIEKVNDSFYITGDHEAVPPAYITLPARVLWRGGEA